MVGRFLIVNAIGTILFLIGCVALLGYIFDEPFLYQWDGDSGMAINTAVCFVLCGIGFVCMALVRALHRER